MKNQDEDFIEDEQLSHIDLDYLVKVSLSNAQEVAALVGSGDIWTEGDTLVVDVTTGNGNRQSVFAFAKTYALKVRYV